MMDNQQFQAGRDGRESQEKSGEEFLSHGKRKRPPRLQHLVQVTARIQGSPAQ